MLEREGHEVTVVDEAAVAAGASGGNGGQLSYAYVQPLAGPSIWRELPRLLLSSSSPLKIRPRFDPAQWRWGLAFLRACTSARSAATTRELLATACASRALFDEMRAAEGIAADFRESGKLVLYRGAASFARAREQMRLQHELGGPAQQALGALEVAGLEPALQHAASGLAGAIYTPGECVADCRAVCERLAQRLMARGVRFVLRTRVTGFHRRGDRVVAARTAQGDIEAERFVLCAGAASAHLARSLGVRLAMYPLKGYSLTLDIASHRDAPNISVTDADRKIVFARIGAQLRVAGMAELVGHDTAIPERRVAALAGATQTLFPAACSFGHLRPWAGLRPATPTGLPIVGSLPGAPANVLFNTGHGALGFTLAFGTAQQVARQLPRPATAPARPVARRA
jgi:D-amino-acid dehydrogenase